MKRILVLINPISGSGRGARIAGPLEQALRSRRLDPEIVLTPGPGSAAAIIRDMGSDFDVVAAVGGDGTISEVAGGIYFSKFEGALALVPMGLSNCLGIHFNIPGDLDGVARIIAEGRTAEMGLAAIGERVSLSFVGAGLDAEVADRVARGRTGPVKNWTYIKAAMAYYKTRQWPRLLVKVDGRPIRGEYFQVLLSSISNYAHYFQLDPEPGFQAYLFKGAGPASLLKVAGMMGWRRRIDKASHIRLPVREKIEVESLKGPGCWQMDGEAGGRLPLACTVIPGAIRVLVPPDF